MCVCEYIYIYIYIYVSVCVNIYIYIYIYIYMTYRLLIVWLVTPSAMFLFDRQSTIFSRFLFFFLIKMIRTIAKIELDK